MIKIARYISTTMIDRTRRREGNKLHAGSDQALPPGQKFGLYPAAGSCKVGQ